MDEQVSWIALEAGAWLNNEGTGGFQAGTAAAQGGVWESVRYHNNFGTDHAVMTHVRKCSRPLCAFFRRSSKKAAAQRRRTIPISSRRASNPWTATVSRSC